MPRTRFERVCWALGLAGALAALVLLTVWSKGG